MHSSEAKTLLVLLAYHGITRTQHRFWYQQEQLLINEFKTCINMNPLEKVASENTHSFSVSQITCSGKISSYVMRKSMERSEALSKQVALICQACKIDSFEMNPLSPVKPSQPQCNELFTNSLKILSQNHPSQSLWIPDPQKLDEIVNVYYCFKSLNLGSLQNDRYLI